MASDQLVESSDLADRPKGTVRLAQRLTLALLVAGSFVAGIGVDRVSHDGANASSTLAEADGYNTLEQTWDLIQNEYVALDTVSEQDLMYGAASGMVDALGDTGHSTFLSPVEAQAFNASSEGEFVGIGIQLDFSTGRPVIISPMDNSPAIRAGLKPEDVITAIDGLTTAGMTPLEVSRLLTGEEGERLTLTIYRPSTEETFDVRLTRERIAIRPISWRMLPESVAQVRISEFSAGATKDLRAVIAELKELGVEGIVLDLRGNPGGLVFEAIGIASEFLPEGSTIYLVQDRDGEPRPVLTIPGGTATNIPLVVLVDGGSASAAEITAAAFTDNGRAEVYGETTFGTGTVLTPFVLEDGSILLLGTELWLEPDGDQAWKEGVEPDVEVELPGGADISRPSEDANVTLAELEEFEDLQLKAAFESLAGDVLADR